jgi:heparin/heparan-sulfate lyase
MKKFIYLLFMIVTTSLVWSSPITLKISSNKTDYLVKVNKTGTYWIVSHSKSLIPAGQQHFATLRLDNGPLLTRRLLGFNRVDSSAELERVSLNANRTYKFYFKYNDKITTVSKVEFVLEKPYPVPKAAKNYKPKLIPPARHPRLFVNPKYLVELKKNITKNDSLPIWNLVKKNALAKFDFTVNPSIEVSYNKALLDAVNAKAFYYLVKGDKKIGLEAVNLIKSYISVVTFGNGQDICRKVGETIFSASLVYDWCYDLISAEEKSYFRKRMLFYAAELETTWPPFRQFASAGHGNETQFNRDLLAMSLAIYNEDPLPYQYVAYQLFELWLPLKKLTYPSGRHSQGTAYGQYRAQFDYLAALQLYRVFGIKVLPNEAKDLPHYWYYLRLPDGCYFIEGDDNWKVRLPQYVPLNVTMLNCLMALYPNADFKMELLRGKKLSKPMDNVLFLLANNPNVKPQDLRAKLPLTKQYKDPLPGMVVRTGWNFTPDSDDLVLAMNGGNRYLVNHQHQDQGSFQLYYRGYLITDLGQYRYYGLEYDRLLNKTAGVHSMMLFRDPEQKPPKNLKRWVNVGGVNMQQIRPPFTAKDLLTDKRFYCGETPRAGFGPSLQKPEYNFLETSLAPSYADRTKSYSRSFVFWNQNDKNRPGTLLILDRFVTKRDNVKPIFQLTTVKKPEVKNGIIYLTTKQGNKTGKAIIQTLIPSKKEIKVLTGEAARTFDGVYIPPRFPERREAKGSRIEISGKGNVYLHALQICDGKLTAQPIIANCKDKQIQVLLKGEKFDYLTVFGDVNKVTTLPFTINVKKDNTRVLLLDLAVGKWNAVNGKNKFEFFVSKDKGNYYAILSQGSWKIMPCKK